MALDPEITKSFDTKTTAAAQKIYDDGPKAVRKLRRAIDKYDSAVELMEQFYFVYDVHVQAGGYRHESRVLLSELGTRFKRLIDGDGTNASAHYYGFREWSPENTHLIGGTGHGTGFMTNDQVKKLEKKEEFETWWAMATKMNHGGAQFRLWSGAPSQIWEENHRTLQMEVFMRTGQIFLRNWRIMCASVV